MKRTSLRLLKKELERLIKQQGMDNLTNQEIIKKSLELELEMYVRSKRYTIIRS